MLPASYLEPLKEFSTSSLSVSPVDQEERLELLTSKGNRVCVCVQQLESGGDQKNQSS